MTPAPAPGSVGMGAAAGTRATVLHELLEQSAQLSPEATALVDTHDRELSYRQLNELASQMAAALIARGVKPGDRVGVCMPKSANSVISVLGALKAGAAYVPAAYDSPAERNRFIYENCQARIVCVDEPRAQSLYPDSKQSTLVFPGEATEHIGADWLTGAGAAKAARAVTPDDLAYILYTSGSTGLPKGVMHTHASAMSFVWWCHETFAPTLHDRFSSHAPFHFDLSILDLYTPMTVGAAIVLVGEDQGKDPHTLGEFISQRRITMWYSVPSILAMLAQYGRLEELDCTPLRVVNFAGEVFPVKHLRLLTEKWPGRAYYNLYGPTETNVCTFFKVPDRIDSERTVPYPIGKACSNCKPLVLDMDGKQVTDGSEGVLYIHQSGPVMKGYWADDERTKKAFHVDAQGEKWYCTGDVVTVDENGDYIFVGRRDRMVKRRGYRIELGEIEAAMYKHPQVREAAAVATESPEGVMITVFAAGKDGAKLSVLAMKQFSMKQLPPYMTPDRFVFMDALPRTSTDKLDYQSMIKSLG
jgi:amino acid adenylation domain-containing protein